MSIEICGSEQTEALQEVCRDGTLPHAQEVFEQENVVMNSHGDLEYARIGTPNIVKKRERKKLVLGFDGYDQYSLAEVNEILDNVDSGAMDDVRARIALLLDKRKA